MDALPSAVLFGKYYRQPSHLRYCFCAEVVETTSHILLHCTLYEAERKELIIPILSRFKTLDSYLEYAEGRLLRFLLDDRIKSVSNVVAKFCQQDPLPAFFQVTKFQRSRPEIDPGQAL